MMRQDRFTQQAQEVLAASQDLVRTQRHSQWDVEHVLLALLQHPEGLAGQVLQRLNVEWRGAQRARQAGSAPGWHMTS
jgi:ATP-dependent Clp protease ATP-binding subunit ClpC